MTDAAVATPGTSADYVIRLTVSEGTVDVANNRSYLYVDLDLVTTAANGAGGAFRLTADTNAYVAETGLGTLINTTQGYDMRPAASLPVADFGHYEGYVTHDADGTKTLHFTFGFTGGGGTPLGNASPNPESATLVMTAIPRGPKVRVGGLWKESVLYVRIGGVWKQAQIYTRVGGVWKSPA